MTVDVPSSVLLGAAEKLLKKLKGGSNPEKYNPSTKSQVVSQIIRLSHNLKKVAERHDVTIVIWTPRKMGQLCQRINQNSQNKRKSVKNHRKSMWNAQ